MVAGGHWVRVRSPGDAVPNSRRVNEGRAGVVHKRTCILESASLINFGAWCQRYGVERLPHVCNCVT